MTVAFLTRGRLAAVATIAAVSMACGGSPPGGPSPQPTPTPTPPVNPPPVVDGIAASAPRIEVNGTLTLTATVRDAETAVGQLQFAWRADAGTFEGQGATVTWRAPAQVTAPTNYTISLTVTESYDSGARQNVVNASGPIVRVHDSPKELGELAMTFLGDFANSSVSANSCVRHFSVNCPGRDQEKGDIEDNRRRYEVIGSSLRLTSARLNQNGTRGDMTVACSFTSRRIYCDPPDPSDPETLGCVVGAVGTSTGNCNMTAVYEQDRWWLCTSTFDSNGLAPPGFRSFLSRRR
jgi:hypothetical protein